MRNLERQSSQWTTHLRGLWCFPNSGTLEKHRAQWSSRIWGLWCFSKNCTVERQNPQWPPQTQVEWCFPKTYNVQRQSPQLTSLTQGLWCLPSNNTLQRYRPQWPSPTRGLWCFPKTCNFQRHRSQWRSLTQGYWCFPTHCTQERQSPQWPWQIQGLPPSPPDGSLERLQPEFPWDLMGCWLGASFQDRSPLFHLPRHFWNRWPSLPLRHVTTLQNPMSDHHLPTIHRPRPLLWGFCGQWDLHNASVQKALPSILSWCWLAWLQRRFHRLLRSSLSASRSWRKVGFPTKMHHCEDTIWKVSQNVKRQPLRMQKRLEDPLQTTGVKNKWVQKLKNELCFWKFLAVVFGRGLKSSKSSGHKPLSKHQSQDCGQVGWQGNLWPSNLDLLYGLKAWNVHFTLSQPTSNPCRKSYESHWKSESLPEVQWFLYPSPESTWSPVGGILLSSIEERMCIMPRFPHDDGTTWSCS